MCASTDDLPWTRRSCTSLPKSRKMGHRALYGVFLKSGSGLVLRADRLLTETPALMLGALFFPQRVKGQWRWSVNACVDHGLIFFIIPHYRTINCSNLITSNSIHLVMSLNLNFAKKKKGNSSSCMQWFPEYKVICVGICCICHKYSQLVVVIIW